MTEIDLESLHASLADDDLHSMNFLNEVALRYPGAVSFASAAPAVPPSCANPRPHPPQNRAPGRLEWPQSGHAGCSSAPKASQ